MAITLRYKNITLYSSWNQSFWGLYVCVCVCVCERERRTETERDEYRLPNWSITSSLDHTMLIRPYLVFMFFGQRVLNRRPLCGPLPQRGSQPLISSPLSDRSLLAASWDSKTTTHAALISRGHLHISFHSSHKFLFNHITASAYFHRFVQCRESLIDGTVKGQYTTNAFGRFGERENYKCKYCRRSPLNKWRWRKKIKECLIRTRKLLKT